MEYIHITVRFVSHAFTKLPGYRCEDANCAPTLATHLAAPSLGPWTTHALRVSCVSWVGNRLEQLSASDLHLAPHCSRVPEASRRYLINGLAAQSHDLFALLLYHDALSVDCLVPKPIFYSTTPKKGWLSSNILRPPSVLISLPLNPSAFSDRCIPFSQRYTSSPNCRVTCVRLLRTSALFTCFYKHISGAIPFTSAILHHHGCYSSKSLRSPRNEYGLEEQADVLSPSTRE